MKKQKILFTLLGITIGFILAISYTLVTEKPILGSLLSSQSISSVILPPIPTPKNFTLTVKTSGYGKCLKSIKSIRINDKDIDTQGTTMKIPANTQVKFALVYQANALTYIGTTYNWSEPPTITTKLREFSVPMIKDMTFDVQFSPFLQSCKPVR